MSYFSLTALPNMITIGRLLLVPLIIVMISVGAWPQAFSVFVIAGISDGIDGWIAKKFHLCTELGALLDPIADKALLISIYITLALSHTIPAALAILVVSRDLMIIGGVITAWVFGRPLEIRPIFISKLNTAAQIALAAFILGSLAFGFWYPVIIQYAGYGIAALTIASAAAYLGPWIKHMGH